MPRWLARIAYDQDMHLHHLSYANLGHETAADVELLCRRCHDLETFGRSDLAAPKSHKCPSCDGLHWNPYSDECDECFRIRAVGFWKTDEFMFANRLVGQRTVWQDIAAAICTIAGPQTLLDWIVKSETGLHVDHAMHVRANQRRKRKSGEK
jgi:5-methylcytosine-specific restriction endonuclease McrA